jgi:Ca-activated chloride channel family protein
MKYRYTKFTGDLLDEIDLEDLVSKLSDLLLSSGFGNPYSTDDEERTMQALHDAILDALFNGGVLPEETIEKLLGDPADGDQEGMRTKLEELIQQIIEKMGEEGYISAPPDLEQERERRQGRGGGNGPDQPPTTFEVTDKTLDFLGYRALRDLLGSLGKSSYGRHDTREQATGIETIGAPKPYEFGDTLNLDPGSTLLNAVQRESRAALEEGRPASRRIHVTHDDLMVVQGEYQSSCATVLMLDCSHSMILYGEDRFTPAKRVALALAQLIKNQYPGDALKVVLFHDSAEEIPLSELGRVRVGPYYTNTREGLRLARRLLDRQRKDMRQIIMINTFMLARDYDLVSFVRRVADICKGKAYFTTPYTLGQYVLMDYMDKKTKTIH